MSRRAQGLVRRVELDVPAKRAFAAVGTLAGVRGWWTPRTSGSTKTGGLLLLRFRGLDETIRFRVETCEAPTRARWLCLGHDSLDEWAGTHLSFTVRARDEGRCSVEFVHEGLVPSLECYASCRAGWAHFLESLVAWAETGRGDPFGTDERPAPMTKVSRANGRRPARRSTPRESAGAEASFTALVRMFEADPRVTLPAGLRGKFGSNGLKVDGKIFAMSLRGALVVKLPASAIDEAVARGRGERLSMGRGRIMKEWLVVHDDERHWPVIARRALAFVGGDR